MPVGARTGREPETRLQTTNNAKLARADPGFNKGADLAGYRCRTLAVVVGRRGPPPESESFFYTYGI